MNVVIGGSRDARPHKARKSKKGSVEVRAGGEVGGVPIFFFIFFFIHTCGVPISVCIYLFACDGPCGGQGRRVEAPSPLLDVPHVVTGL